MERGSGAPGELLGRRQECAALDDLIAGVEGGSGAVLVIHGEAGIGKTALLDHARSHARGCRLAQIAGVESEADLAFGGLQQLCGPFGVHFDRLPSPQRAALETAFGLSAGNPPDRFLVGLAVLSLLAAAADDRPLVCLIDDAQWLDQVSTQALAFVARRLLAERVVLIFAVREPAQGNPLMDLPRIEIVGLADQDARALLAAGVPGRLEARAREQVLAEARGNPLALLELPRGMTAMQPADEPLTAEENPVVSRIERGFQRRIRLLAPDTQRFLLLAAAEPVGDAALLRRAAGRLGIPVDDSAAEAGASDLVTRLNVMRFRHPLVRSAAYRAASARERQDVHRALSEEIDPHHDPDRRAWHLARAVDVPDEEVAADLERAAARALARGGTAAAGAFLSRAAQLTPEPERQGSRALAAAQAKSQAGAFDEALELVAMARLCPLDERQRAQADLVRGRILFFSRSASAGLPSLLAAARRLQHINPTLATETYRDAIYAALTAGRLPGDTGVEQVAAAFLAAPRTTGQKRSVLLLEGLARVVTEDYAAGVPLLQGALAEFRSEQVLADEEIGWLPLACRMAHDAWEFESWSDLSSTLVERTYELGAVAVLPSALLLRLSNRVYAGDLSEATALAARAKTLGDATGSDFVAHYGALVIQPWLGQEADTLQVIEVITHDLLLRGEGKVLTATQWAAAVLYNGLGRFEEALAAAKRGSAYPLEMGLSTWSMVELVEAATRLGRPDEATEAVRHINGLALSSGTDWALGTAALVSAQMIEGPAAEELYRDAIHRVEAAGVGMLAARAHLVFGEWLRRADRRNDARRVLAVAHDRLTDIGAAGFAERARRELAATGVTMSRPAPGPRMTLTPQETQIARLAVRGLTNGEIGAQLFISGHTVEWHLRKVFAKLGVRSRRDIGSALGDDAGS